MTSERKRLGNVRDLNMYFCVVLDWATSLDLRVTKRMANNTKIVLGKRPPKNVDEWSIGDDWRRSSETLVRDPSDACAERGRFSVLRHRHRNCGRFESGNVMIVA